MEKNPNAEISVTGGGSGTGIAALINGKCEIANASREMKQKEITMAEQQGQKVKRVIVARDGLSVIVNENNPIDKLTMEEIGRIFRGEIVNWKDPGGSDVEINMYGRQSSSGTYEFLRSRVLKNVDFKLGSCDLNGSKEVVELVANTPGAIAYSGMGYATGEVKMLRVREKPDSPAILPSEKSAMDKSYPISRSLLMYTLGEPTGEVKNYLDWVLTDAGQMILKQNGYVPVRELAARQ